MHAFDVLGDPIRRRILELLADDEHAAGAIADIVCREFSVSQAAVSQHLKVLRDNGFAAVRKDGVRRLYSVQTEGLREIDGWLERFRHFWEPKLDALATEIARGRKARRRAADAED